MREKIMKQAVEEIFKKVQDLTPLVSEDVVIDIVTICLEKCDEVVKQLKMANKTE